MFYLEVTQFTENSFATRNGTKDSASSQMMVVCHLSAVVVTIYFFLSKYTQAGEENYPSMQLLYSILIQNISVICKIPGTPFWDVFPLVVKQHIS